MKIIILKKDGKLDFIYIYENYKTGCGLRWQMEGERRDICRGSSEL